MDCFCLILGFIHFFETSTKSCCLAARKEVFFFFLSRELYVHTQHKKKKTVQMQHCASQQLLIWKTRGEGTDSLVAVVIVYHNFKGIQYQKSLFFNSHKMCCNGFREKIFLDFCAKKKNHLISE